MKWFYPTLRECLWAQNALARLDIRQREWREKGRFYIRFEDTPESLQEELEEHYAIQYTQTGNPAWLKLGNDLQEPKP